MKKFIAILLVLTLLLALPTGCGSEKVNKEMSSTYLIWNIGAESKTFDPGKNSAADGGDIITNLFEGLYGEEDGKLVPTQAEGYTLSEDGCTYTFTLKDGLVWSDGKPVVAGDYEYAWKRVCDPATMSEYSFIMSPYLKYGDLLLNCGSTNYTDDDIATLKAAGANITDAQYAMLKDCAPESDTEEEGKDYVPVPEDELTKIKDAIKEIVGVKATDDKTLVVTLNNPCSYFLSLVSFYTYYPVRKDAVEAGGEGWEKNVATCISNGPFMLEEYAIGSHLLMKKNPLYREADKVRLAGIKGLMIVDANTAHNGFKAGEIQVNNTIPTDLLPELYATDTNFHREATVGANYVTFNVDKAPMNDVRVRKAFSLAIDRVKMTEQVSKTGAIPATGIVPPNLKYSDGSSCRVLDKEGRPAPEFGIDPLNVNIEEAKKLLAEAGYPDGEGFPKITYLYNSNDGNKKVAEALQEMWKSALNVEVELVNQEWQVFQDTRRKGEFDIARGAWSGDYGEPMTMLDLFTSYSGNNDCQWRYNLQPIVAPHDTTLNPENEAFDQAIQKALVSTGAEKDAAYKEAEKILMENWVLAVMEYRSANYMIDSSKVDGVERTMMGQWVFKNAEMLD